jgi:hypothetical protein
MFCGEFGDPSGGFPGDPRGVPPDADVEVVISLGFGDGALLVQSQLVLMLVG